jgi:hypothetical protein
MESALPDHINDGVISQFAHIYQAWGWFGLGEYEKAAELVLIVIQYRQSRFGENDEESIK